MALVSASDLTILAAVCALLAFVRLVCCYAVSRDAYNFYPPCANRDPFYFPASGPILLKIRS
jgi:hypothetical protein